MRIFLLVFVMILVGSMTAFSSYEVANSKYLKGDVNGALSEITKDITSGVRDSRLYYFTIKIHKENLKDYSKAIDYTIEAIKLFPQESKKFSTELAELYFLSGKYDRSLAILLNLNSDYPGDIDILYLIGLDYYYTGHYYKSLVAFEASKYLGNRNLDLYEFLGKTYSKVGKYRESLELLSYVYNSTGRKDILAQIVEIANILDINYSDYIVKKSQSISPQYPQQQMKKSVGGPHAIPTPTPPINTENTTNVPNTPNPNENTENASTTPQEISN